MARAFPARLFFFFFFDKENFRMRCLVILWTVGREGKFKCRHWRFFLAVLKTCWGKAHSSFFPHVEVVIHALYECHKNIWKIGLIIYLVIVQSLPG
uniref:Uncharacterized protein n=1 Tax=Capra hircus TaxID=9925 RepID=A0A8C2PP29_CAPHI